MKESINKMYYNYLITLSLALTLAACGSKKTAESAPADAQVSQTQVILTEAQAKNAQISLEKLERRSLSTVLKVNGVIDVPPQNMISVSMPLGGYLTSTKLLPGMHIRKGEVIATLEDQQYIQLQQDYLITKSKLAYSELELKRQTELNQSKASSDKVLQMAEAENKLLKITLNALAEKLKLININPSKLTENNLSKSVQLTSSIAGFVSKVNVNIGKYVNPSDVLFELVNPADIHLNLKVYEKDLSKLFIGQKLMTYNNSNVANRHPCEIILISKSLSADHASEVHCHFKDYDPTLLPGMYMNAEIEVKSTSVSSIPESCILNVEGKDFVFVQTAAMSYELTQVTLGAQENGYVEIQNAGVLENKQIVNKGAYTLLMKMKNVEE